MELANGTYRAKATQGALGLTKTGSEQVGVLFRLVGEGVEGKYITWYGYFTEKTIDRTIESLRICGWAGNDLEDLSGIDANEVELVVENEEWEGNWSPKVRWVNRAGGFAMAAPLQATQAKAFAAKMKGAILAYDKKAGAPAPKTNGQKPAPKPSASPEPPPIATDPNVPPF